MSISSDRLWVLRDEIAELKKERNRLLKDLFLADSDEDLIFIENQIEKLSEEHDRVWDALKAYRGSDE